MPRAALDHGIALEYDTIGSPDDPALLLVCGFTSQLINWDDRFCRLLAGLGRFVIRYDNRDCGLSTKLDGHTADPAAVLAAQLAGEPVPEVPYTLSDMAADGIGLLDHLGIDRAHIAGVSMGGMIVQTMVIEHAERLMSATSIMSSIGDRGYGQATPDAMGVLLAPPPSTRDAAVARSADFAVWSSQRWFDPDDAARRSGRAFDRSFYPDGAPRQLAAIHASGDRTEALRGVTTPTLVIHGLDDTLIHPSGGRRTAELIPGAHLLELAGMGHDLPEPLWPLITSAIVAHGDAAAADRSVEVAA